MLEVKNHDGSWPRKMELILFEYPHTHNTKLWSFDVFDTVGRCRTDKAMHCFLFIDTVIQKMRELFSISITDECRLWRKHYSSYSLLRNSSNTLYDLGINNNEVISS